MENSYHYGTEADQYAFFQIPKILFTDPVLSRISSEAKVLYGMMLSYQAFDKIKRGSDDPCFGTNTGIPAASLKASFGSPMITAGEACLFPNFVPIWPEVAKP